MDETEARFLIADQLAISPALAIDGAGLDDLGADALDIVALVLRVEKAYGVRIADDRTDACRTVGDVLDALRLALNSKVETPKIGLRWSGRA